MARKRKCSRERAKVPKRPKPKEQPRLRCPIRVHREQAGSSEGDAEFDNCNQGQTFAGTEKLNEHLDRVHSPKWWCSRCKHKFVVCGGRNLNALKKDHGGCEEKPWPENQKEWVKHNLMTEEQYLRSKTWKEENIPRSPACNGKPKERKAMWSWRKIYKRLFPDTHEFPNPCHVDPPSSQDATSQDATSQDANSAETDEGDTTSTKTGDSSPTDSPENGAATDQAKPVADRNSSAIPHDETVLHHSFPDTVTDDLFGLPAFFPDQDEAMRVPTLFNPYSADLTGEEHRNRDDDEGQLIWRDDPIGPASMAFSDISGGTGIPRPRTPSFFGEPFPESGIARISLDLFGEGTRNGGFELADFLNEGGLKDYGPLESGLLSRDGDLTTQGA